MFYMPIVFREFIKTLRRPYRLTGVFNKSVLSKYLIYMRIKLRFGEHWDYCEFDRSFKYKRYRTYQEYIAHQQLKLGTMDLSYYDINYHKILRERLEVLGFLERGTSVLCLAARIGTEVKAFLDIGCFALGIDVNPGDKNRYVVWGDFHDIQFPPQSVDVVFTNSVDHVFDVQKLINEIKRVLKKEGILILEAGEVGPGDFESFCWSTVESLVSLFKKSNFKLIKMASFEYPWKGQQICLKNQG